MKITPTSLTINQLFGSTNEQYVVPAYQRRYSWHEKQVHELIDDIEALDGNDTHLLGSVVCLTGHHKAGLNELELVDGQQRITTLSIVLECLRERLEAEDAAEEASEVRQLLTARALGGTSGKKVALDSIDANEFSDLVQNAGSGEFKNKNLARAFEIVRERAAEVSLTDIRAFLYKLRNQALVIRLDVGHAKDAFKLFETINNRGLKLSPTDIIKNFLLGNAARFGASALDLARRNWTEVLGHLDGTNSDGFFRYYLMSVLQTRMAMSEVVAEFKKYFMKSVSEAEALPGHADYKDSDDFDDDDAGGDEEHADTAEQAVPDKRVSFQEFITHLNLCAKVYGELQLAKTGDARFDRHLRNLRMIKAIQTYGFLMHLRSGGCADKDFLEILRITESFILRRHVCRERTNETEALFARLCGADASSPVKVTKEAYRALCPPDEKVRQEFSQAHFAANLIDRARYCLERIELSKHGKHNELNVLGSDDVHVEHIMPQKIKTKSMKKEFGDWVSYLGPNAEAMHPRYVDRIGNMTLFAGPLNIGASNNPFARKKTAYKESAIQITKELTWKSNFRFKDIEKRSRALADAAVEIWPAP